MGCGSSSQPQVLTDVNKRFVEFINSVNDLQFVDVDNIWLIAKLPPKSLKYRLKSTGADVKRTGWKTVRIFVSSTFKDFHEERETLVKRVFPDLRQWCQLRRLHLVECDLRWGVPKDATTEDTLRTCLGEIDRCYNDNNLPFFINMTSERIGWVPMGEEIPAIIKSEYEWIEGLSVTEMEIMHGSYRVENPNALFMLRDPSFLESVPLNDRAAFVDGQHIAPYKIQALRGILESKFKEKQLKYYTCQYDGVAADGHVRLAGLEDNFAPMVMEFFKARIAQQYPHVAEDACSEDEKVTKAHSLFMTSSAQFALANTSSQISHIVDYVESKERTPYLLVGTPGSGKSTLMAAAGEKLSTMKKLRLFCHFIGSVPGSTDPYQMMKRIANFLKIKSDISPSDLALSICSTLASYKEKVVLLIDAYNQLDENTSTLNWVPQPLSDSVKVIISFVENSSEHKFIMSTYPNLPAQYIAPLTSDAKKAIVEDLLGKFNKRLDADQLELLLSNKASQNPLWLSLACEELRLFGLFRQVSVKISSFADDLLSLECQVLARFETETSRDLLVAALCLLETSEHGLLEAELLELLGDKNLLPIALKYSNKETDEDDLLKDNSSEKHCGCPAEEGSPECKQKHLEEGAPRVGEGRLLAHQWAEVFRVIRPFVRPFGEPGEGRLSFYHRSFSKAVRRKYFFLEDKDTSYVVYAWFHRKLADFFENFYITARVYEEYPSHVSYLKDGKRLSKFLCQWDVITSLFDRTFSRTMSAHWSKVEGAYEEMARCYLQMCQTECAELKEKELRGAGATADVLLEFANRCMMICLMLSQSGETKAAQNVMELIESFGDAIDLDNQPHLWGEMCFVKCRNLDNEAIKWEYMYRSQIPHCIDTGIAYETAIAAKKKLPDSTRTREEIGLCYNRAAFFWSGIALRGGFGNNMAREEHNIPAMDPSVCIARANIHVDAADEIFTALGNQISLADTFTTRGVVIGRSCALQLEHYKTAEDILNREAGGLSVYNDRLFLNLAIYYEEMGDYYTALDYFLRWKELCTVLFGVTHPKTQRAHNTLREPMYKRILIERGVNTEEPDAEDE